MPYRKFLLVFPLLVSLSACGRADVVPDMPSLRQQIDQSTPEVISVLTESPDARSYLVRLHPGSLFYLAASLSSRGQYAEARILFQEQLAQGAGTWQVPAFRGWLDCLKNLQDWQTVVDEAPVQFSRLRQPPAAPSADGGLLKDWLALVENYHRVLIEAKGHTAGIPATRELADAARTWFVSQPVGEIPGIGESRVPIWLQFQAVRIHMAANPLPPQRVDEAVRQSLLPYVLGVEARDGHGDIAWYLDQKDATAGKAAKAVDPDLAAFSQLVRAKQLLAGGQAALAWELYRDFVAWPKAKKTELARVKEIQGSLVGLHREAGIEPLMLVRDLYNAARLAGRISDGIVALESLAAAMIKLEPAWKTGPLLAYALELEGRLAKARDDNNLARQKFSAAHDLAMVNARQHTISPADARRIEWYLLDSMVAAADDQAGPLFGLDRTIALARDTDDPEYFNDVFEAAVLKIGARADWGALERWDREVGDHMMPLLRHRCAILLARSIQIADPGRAGQNPLHQAMMARLLGQTESLYYRMLALWMRGEAPILDRLLADMVPPMRFLGAGSDPGPSETMNWAETVGEGYCQMGMYAQGMDFIWNHRLDMGLPALARIGRHYVEAGRYRQGLKILDSIRIRAGHPADRGLLAAFYPRPFSAEMAEAIGNGQVPEWLMYALVRTESNFDTGAQSGPGARGLSQLMPATAKAVAANLRIENADLADPAVNLRLGVVFLADQWRAQGRWPQALAAYNAGSGRVRSWIRAGLGTDPILFAELIPFPETRNYVRRITEGAALYAWLDYGMDAGQVLSFLYTPAATYRQ